MNRAGAGPVAFGASLEATGWVRNLRSGRGGSRHLTTKKRPALGPQLPGSACPTNPIKRHDPFRLNDRDRTNQPPLPIRSDSTSAVASDRPAPSIGQAEIGGPSASKRTGWSDETVRLEFDSRRLDQPPADRTRRLSLTIATRPAPTVEGLNRSVPSTMLSAHRTTPRERHRLVPAERHCPLQRPRARCDPVRPERRRVGLDRWTFHFSATSPFMRGPARHKVIAF
jgi:hypothetical protein